MRDQAERDMQPADSNLPAPTNLELLRVNDLLVGLEDAAFEKFAEHCHFLEIPKGERVMETGDINSSILFVVRGTVRITGASEGMEMIYADVPQGQWFGEIAAIDRGARSADAFALDDVVVAVAAREVFLNLILEHRHIAVKILESLAATVRSSNRRMVKVGSLSGVQRVYMQILEMAEPSPEADGTWIIAKLPSHDDMAIQALTSRDVVARAVSQLLQSNIAKRDRGAFRLISREKLKQLATQI